MGRRRSVQEVIVGLATGKGSKKKEPTSSGSGSGRKKRNEKVRSKSLHATKIEKDIDVPRLAAKSNTLQMPNTGQSTTSSGRKKRKDKERRTSTPLFGSHRKISDKAGFQVQSPKSPKRQDTSADLTAKSGSSGRKS